MADQTPISDELDGTRPENSTGGEPGSGAATTPEHSQAETPAAQPLDVDAEPNDTDSQLPPGSPEPGNASSIEIPAEEPGTDSPAGDGENAEAPDELRFDADTDDDEDAFGDESIEDDDDFGDEDADEMEDLGGLNVDAEPNDTDSQLVPPDAQDDFSDASDDMTADIGEVHEMEDIRPAEQMAGSVSLVGVPIGHRDDITFRALRTLQMADIVVCEEYKTAARLLRNYNISKKLIEMNEHNEDEASDEVIELIRKGKKVAVISDAGLPVLADPGRLLSVKLRKLGVEPKIIPGVSSVMTGLMASGYSMDRFEFVGFLPRKPEERQSAANALARRDTTLVILEAPYRLRSLLVALAEAMPNRRAALAINLTTSFETTIRGTLAELNAKFAQKRFKGEFVVVLDRLVPTDLGISTTAGFDPRELEEELEEDDDTMMMAGEFDETEDLDLSPRFDAGDDQTDAGERPLRRSAPRPAGGPREGRGAAKPSGRFGERGERAPRRDGGANRGFDRRGDGGRENRFRREGQGGFDDRRGREGSRDNRWGGPPRDDRRGGAPRENRWNRDGERREGGFNREDRPNRGERRDGGRGFTPREGGGRGFTPREGGGRGFTPRDGGDRGFTPRGEGGGRREGGTGRGFTPRDGRNRGFGGGNRGFGGGPKGRGGNRGSGPRGGGGGWR